MDGCIRLNRAENGYTVCVRDPAIVLNNDKPNTPWRDPEREYVFESMKGALAFIEAIADKALPKNATPKDSFADAFDKAAAAQDDDDA